MSLRVDTDEWHHTMFDFKDLEFIDSYPMTTTALFTLDPDVLHTEELLNKLKTEI